MHMDVCGCVNTYNPLHLDLWGGNDSNIGYDQRLIWTPMSAVRKRPINLITHSLTHSWIYVGVNVQLIYDKTSNVRGTLAGNKIVDHSDVAGASPVGADPTTS